MPTVMMKTIVQSQAVRDVVIAIEILRVKHIILCQVTAEVRGKAESRIDDGTVMLDLSADPGPSGWSRGGFWLFIGFVK